MEGNIELTEASTPTGTVALEVNSVQISGDVVVKLSSGELLMTSTQVSGNL